MKKEEKVLVGNLETGYRQVPYATALQLQAEQIALRKAHINYSGFSKTGTFNLSPGAGPDFIKDVIFNDPATIVIWKDDTKTVVKAEGESFDPEKGFAMAVAKKFFGNKGNYYDIFKKWLPKEENHAEELKYLHEDEEKWLTVSQFAEKFGMSKSTIQKQCRKGIFGAKKVSGKWMIPVKVFK